MTSQADTASEAPVRLVLADDHTLFRDGLKHLLEAAGFEVVAEADNGDDALALIAEHEPSIALLDVQMDGPGPVGLLELVKERTPQTRIIFLSMYEPPQLLRELQARGMSAYLRKTVDREVLNTTVRAVSLGLTVHPDRPAQTPASGALTNLELRLLQLAAASYSNREIAETMFISESTVKRGLAGAYRKLGAKSRVEALARALQNGLITARDTAAGN